MDDASGFVLQLDDISHNSFVHSPLAILLPEYPIDGLAFRRASHRDVVTVFVSVCGVDHHNLPYVHLITGCPGNSQSACHHSGDDLDGINLQIAELLEHCPSDWTVYRERPAKSLQVVLSIRVQSCAIERVENATDIGGGRCIGYRFLVLLTFRRLPVAEASRNDQPGGCHHSQH